ncbi:PE-PGRS family protein [Rhodococcus sp. WS3]|uniref:PE-PGRS family protein n=1 Tax=Rhodococcus sp. WS3 TaxID=2486271 RepID=UPI001143C163|nr:PE-PGRS family protein [Rhodococcus sp. WS3]ROZ50623.1 PE-PGRS family protein [Rhodococcus sp. WS3]
MKVVRQAAPEPIREHWADIGGVRYPPKQAYQLISNLPRSSFTSHTALARLRGIGFTTSIYRARVGEQHAETDTDPSAPSANYTHLSASFSTLLEFLTTNELTKHLSSAESAFAGSDMTGCADTVERFHFNEDLLDAALAVRQHVGRLNDVIHATVIARCLPLILEPGETVTVRPSLGAGNDPSRPFDVETDRRIAEFKVSQWKGADTMRKRGVFADLVHLALDPTERHAQMFVVGALPRKFLVASRSTAEWALGRSSPHTRLRFEEKFGPAGGFTVAEFTAGPAAHIEIIDIATLVPSLGLADELI